MNQEYIYRKLIEEKNTFDSIFQSLDQHCQNNSIPISAEKLEYYRTKIEIIRKMISDFNIEFANNLSPSIEECNQITDYNKKIDSIIQPFLLPLLLYSTIL